MVTAVSLLNNLVSNFHNFSMKNDEEPYYKKDSFVPVIIKDNKSDNNTSNNTEKKSSNPQVDKLNSFETFNHNKSENETFKVTSDDIAKSSTIQFFNKSLLYNQSQDQNKMKEDINSEK